MRECGNCQLCCRLLPISGIDKAANQRCQHQSFARGCKVYNGRPQCCALWSCRWLTNDDTADLHRPDRAHYVIDPVPEFIRLEPHDGGLEFRVPVIQIWCDPKFPDAHRDGALRDYLHRRGAEGHAAIVRYSPENGFAIFPPSLTGDSVWHEKGGINEKDHSAEEVARTLAILEKKRKTGL